MFSRSDEKPMCPFLKGQCVEDRCRMWVRLGGRHPQTGEPVDDWNCSFALAPMLQLEIARSIGGVQEAVVSHRNEHVGRMDAVLQEGRLVHQG